MDKAEAIIWADKRRLIEKSDGCTMAPDCDFTECCERHDMMIRFNQGITDKEADRYLRECIIDHGHPVKAWIYWLFVRYSNLVGDWRFATALLFFAGLIAAGVYFN